MKTIVGTGDILPEPEGHPSFAEIGETVVAAAIPRDKLDSLARVALSLGEAHSTEPAGDIVEIQRMLDEGNEVISVLVGRIVRISTFDITDDK